jgi:hypothetical protein
MFSYFRSRMLFLVNCRVLIQLLKYTLTCTNDSDCFLNNQLLSVDTRVDNDYAILRNWLNGFFKTAVILEWEKHQ